MGQLLWLASYPKSGNTWVRALLANYLTDSRAPVDIDTLPNFAVGDMRIEYYARVAGRQAGDLTAQDFNTLRPRAHALLAGEQPGVTFIKTHSLLSAVDGIPLITPEVTFGAIYIIRNPLDVVVSFADHYGLDIDAGIHALCFPDLKIEPRADQVTQYLSDWSRHVRSWRDAPGLYRHLVRYEDLSASTERSFAAIVDFLKVKKDRERLMRAIRHSTFQVLAEQERQHGFRERSRHAERFFRTGKVGGWRAVLTPDQVNRLVAYHRTVMTEVGYLDASGRLLV